jgi:hypothetical protein
MAEISKYSWVLVGVRPLTEEKLPQESLERMLAEAFIPEKTYTLFLCGAEIDKVGTLAEMEEGLEVLKSGMEDYKDGDYCIISQHEEGSLLFLPMEMEATDENLGGDPDSLQG